MGLIKSNEKLELLYIVICDSYANLDNALDIWIKFASYLKPDEVSFMQEISDKDLTLLSQAEKNIYYKIQEQLEISKLLIKYKNKECTKEEHDKVVEFMHTSLRAFVASKLTDNELRSAKEFISSLSTKTELRNYIFSNLDNYEELSVYKAYILFEIKEKKYYQEQAEIYEKMQLKKREESNNLHKNLIRDYGLRK